MRISPEEPAVQELLDNEQEFAEYSGAADRINAIAVRLQELRDELSSGAASPTDALDELQQTIKREPRAFAAQHLFFKIAGEVGAASAAWDVAGYLLEQRVRIIDLGLRAGKALEASGDIQHALNMYVLGIAETPRNQEVAHRLLRLVESHAALTATARERLEIIRSRALLPEVVDSLVSQLGKPSRSCAATSGRSSPTLSKAPAGKHASDPRAWAKWAENKETYEAYLIAGQQVERLDNLGLAQHLFGQARRLNRDETIALQGLQRLQSVVPAASGSCADSQSGSSESTERSSHLPTSDDTTATLGRLLKRVRQSSSEQKPDLWKEVVDVARNAQKHWLASVAEARCEGLSLPQTVRVEQNDALTPMLSDVRSLLAAGLIDEAQFAWLHCGSKVSVNAIPPVGANIWS